MSKSSSGAKSGRSAKSSAAGSLKDVAIVQKKAIQTSEDHILLLRKALFTDQGVDKDVTAPFKPFLSFKRNGLNLDVEFSARLGAKERKWAFDLSRENMADVDIEMTDAERMDELKYKANRFLIVREATEGSDDELGKAVGYAMFRFTMQGELLDEMCGLPSLYVYDLQLISGYQRKGIGSHLMNLMQLIGRKEGMSYVSIIVPDGCEPMDEFLEKKLPTFEEDCFDYAETDEIEMDAITVYHRCIDPSLAKSKKTVTSVARGVLGPFVSEANKKTTTQTDSLTPAR